MEEKKVSLLKSGLNYGVMLGLALVVYSVILFILDLWMNPWVGLLSFAFYIAGIVYVTKVYRTALGGFISFKDAFLIGFVTVVVSSLITTVYNYLFYTVINPDAIEQILNYSMEMMEKFNLPEEAMEEAMKKVKAETTIGSTVSKSFIYGIIGGAVISLITAAAMKKNPEVQEF